MQLTFGDAEGLGKRKQTAAGMLDAVNAHLARKGQSLRSGTIVDATLIAAPSLTKNADRARP